MSIPKAARHVKHHELLEFWYSYPGPKCKYLTYLNRATRYWYSKEEAIHIDPKPMWQIVQSRHDEFGRVCMKCGTYRLYDQFHRRNHRSWHMNYSSQCKICRNTQRQETRKITNYAKDKEYRDRTRKLEIWQIIVLWLLKDSNWMVYWEDKWKVLWYQKRKWYLIKNVVTWAEKRIDTGNNPNSTKILYKI